MGNTHRKREKSNPMETHNLPVKGKVVGLVIEMATEQLRAHEWMPNGLPRPDVIRYTYEGKTYLIEAHPFTHAQATGREDVEVEVVEDDDEVTREYRPTLTGVEQVTLDYEGSLDG